MPLHRLVGGLIADLVQGVARLLLLVLGRQRVDALLLGAIGLEALDGGLLRHAQRAHRRAEIVGVAGGRMQLFVEEVDAADPLVAGDGLGVDAEGDAAEPADVAARHDRRSGRPRRGQRGDRDGELDAETDP